MINNLKKLSVKSRINILKTLYNKGGGHIGGALSIIDFLLTLYSLYLKKNLITSKRLYNGNLGNLPYLVFSKGHCYIAQLAALDSVNNKTKYLDQYLKNDTFFFGHPKKNINNKNFLVSSGALGQGLVFSNGLAFANKLTKKNQSIISIVGDGEINEGSCTEAFLFASQHKLNHFFIIDNNKQISLGKTSNILSLGNLNKRLKSYGLNVIECNGHDFKDLIKICNLIIKNNKNHNENNSYAIILNTIKGKGVSFMEGNPKWHSRRFKNNEYELAIKELIL